MARAWYTTREEVKAALDIAETARANADIDRQIAAACDAIDGRMHRKFFPQVDTRSFDWPTVQNPWPWRLWLNQHEVISVTQLSSGGIVIPSANYLLYPTQGPPYTHLELNLSQNSTFNATSTWQYSITLQALYGYSDDQIPAGAVPTGGIDGVSTSINLGVPGYRGVGSILLIDSERMLVTGRAFTTTSTTVQGALTSSAAANLVPVTSIAAYGIGETILIDGEKMLIQDAAGSNLIVKRQWDGTPLATHNSGATIYANRQLTVTRGALGTTAAAHTATTAIQEHDSPGLIRQLATAQAVASLIQTRAGYAVPTARKPRVGQGTNVPATQPSDLSTLWDDAYTEFGRKNRTRSA